jgi:hypothetical protein
LSRVRCRAALQLPVDLPNLLFQVVDLALQPQAPASSSICPSCLFAASCSSSSFWRRCINA